MGSAELQVAQVADGSEQTSAEAAGKRLPIAQSAGGPTADGYLLTFVMPQVTSGSLLRLRLDGADLPVAVKVPARVRKGEMSSQERSMMVVCISPKLRWQAVRAVVVVWGNSRRYCCCPFLTT